MKKQVFGFASITQYVNNAPGAISDIGELSVWSQTYSMTKGEFANPSYPGFTLTTFSVTDVTNGKDQVLNATESTLVLRVAFECNKYATTHPGPLDPMDFQNSIQATMFGEIQNLTLGALVQGPGVEMPAWFEYTEAKNDKNIVKIWISDPSFSSEYPDFDIAVVPPHDDVNIFAGNWQTAVDKVKEWNNLRLIEAVQEAKNRNPETYLRYYEFDFVNKNNKTQKSPTSWYILVYGEAGDNEDAHKDAIIDKLVKDTGKPSDFWEPIFPDLFKRTEFILYPRWDKLSVPNVSNLTALYSPFNDVTEVSTYVKKKCTFYPSTHFTGNIFDFPLTFKSITINGVNGINNVDDQKKLWQVWPDYIAVDTSSNDFQRMQERTKEWVHFMMRLIISAETATTTSGLPQGLRRSMIDNKMYIVGSHNKASYKAYARMNA